MFSRSPQSKLMTAAGLLIAAAALLVIQPELAKAQSSEETIREGEKILVLRNGQMLIGRIEQSSDSLIVKMWQGSRLVIQRAKADFVCASKSEAFWGKLARLRASDTNGQVSLFRWCLKHKMLDHAETQLGHLMQTDISAAELETLNRQLTTLITRQRNQKIQSQDLATTKTPSATSVWSPPENPAQRLPAKERSHTEFESSKIAQASFVVPVTQQPTIAASQSTVNDSRHSTASASIPDLAPTRLQPAPLVSADPYDPSAFNAETLRLNATREN